MMGKKRKKQTVSQDEEGSKSKRQKKVSSNIFLTDEWKERERTEKRIEEIQDIIMRKAFTGNTKAQKKRLKHKLSTLKRCQKKQKTKHPRKLKERDYSSEEIGLTHSHSLFLSKFSSANDVIVVWRPVNPEAAERLDRAINPYMGKGLNTKGKSSNFGPIAGDIPYEAGLSKVSITDPKHVAAFSKKNEMALEKDEKQYAELKDQITAANLDSINDLLLVTTIGKKTVENEPVYYVRDADGKIVWNAKETSPIFLLRNAEAKDQEQYFFYDNNRREFSETSKPLSAGCKSEVVEIMAYRQFEMDGDKVVEKLYPITADYDELVSVGRKIFPFHNNERIRTWVSKGNYENLAASYEDKPMDHVQLVTDFILEYELQKKRDHRDAVVSAQQPGMGLVNAWQRAAKAHLKLETGGATNHGPEVNNPFPEKILPGNYMVYLPDGRIKTLHNEEEICNFINEQRALGFPLDVNPKWGWEIDNSTGKFYIPEHRFDWDYVHDQVKMLRTEIVSLESEQIEIMKPLGIKITDANIKSLKDYYEAKEVPDEKPALEKDEPFSGNIQFPDRESAKKVVGSNIQMKRFSAQEAYEMDIINAQVFINKLHFEPDIIYSEYVNNTSDKPNENTTEKEFREALSRKIRDAERQCRSEMLEKENNKLAKKIEEFETTFQEDSIISRARKMLSQKVEVSALQSPQEQDGLSLSSNCSGFFADKPRKKVYNKTESRIDVESGDSVSLSIDNAV